MTMEWIWGLLGLVAGLGGGFLLAKALAGGRSVPRADYDLAIADKTGALARLEELRSEYAALKDELENRTKEAQSAREQCAVLTSEKDSLNKRIAEHRSDLENMQAQFKDQFENLANRIFEEKSEKFKQQSHESLSEMLNPLRERLSDFQKKIDESFGVQAREQFALKEEIKRIVETSKKMTFQTENLARALKGDSKTQGDWGEVVLERILEDSGLRRNAEYILQGAEMGLKDADGARQKPDATILLPEGKHIIIDSKVSLTHYERYCAEEDEAARPLHLRQFIASVRKHVTDLEERRYQDNEKLGSPDFVLMFMPIEGAYVLALQQDRELHKFAWDRRIVIVSPPTLLATLKTVASVWRLEQQNRNAVEIARRGGALYDKIAGFVEDMQRLGGQIGTVQKTFDGAMSKLSSGRGNILRQTEQLRDLGVQSSKSLPRDLIEGEDDDGEIKLVKNAANS